MGQAEVSRTQSEQVAVELDCSLRALAIELPEEVWNHHKERVDAFVEDRMKQIVLRKAGVERALMELESLQRTVNTSEVQAAIQVLEAVR